MKTLTHQLRDLGISVKYSEYWRYPLLSPGKRAKKTLQRKAIKDFMGKLNQLAVNINRPVCWPRNTTPLTIDDLLKFTKLMHRMPVPEDRVNAYKTFELWFALVYNDEENKPLEESVFYSESKAHQLFNSL